VVVVLEDLHWADTASLRLLEFAVQHTWFERLLLVGTYRDVEVEAGGHPLQPLLTPLLAKATTVTLTGLGSDEVGALMARTAGREPEPDLVAEVHRRTGGNPFFVEQTARLWHSGSSAGAIAPGVRDALRRRISLLPVPVGQVLTAAAVLGREFHRQLLAASAEAPVPQVDRLLDQAVAARLVVVLGAGRFAFIHDLVRETLYEALGEADLRARHAAVVRALDRSPALADRVLPADLARHAYLAGDQLEPDRAVDLLLDAAKDAGTRLATEESLGHYRRAGERVAGCARRRQVLVTVDLGRELRHVGEREEARALFQEAAALARAEDDPELLARIALTLRHVDGQDDLEGLGRELLAEAHGRLIRGGEPASTPFSPERLAEELSVHLAMRARLAEDDDALVFGLWARHDSIWGLGSATERVALTDELIAVGRRAGDSGIEHFASSLRWVALLELGDPRYLDQFNAFVGLTERADQPMSRYMSIVDRSIIAALNGRFQESELLLDEVVATAEESKHEHFGFMADHLRWALWQLQGRFEDLAGLERTLGERGHPHPRLLAGITAAQRDDPAAALRYRDDVTVGGEPYPRPFAPLALRLQAQLAVALRDPELCERTRAALTPYRGQWLVSLYGCDISGPVDLWLGMVDAVQGRWDEAVEGLTAAHRSAEQLQTRPWSVEARTALAQTLLDRGDAEAVPALLADLAREAAEFGMRHIVERVERMRTATPATQTAAAHVFRRDGAVWTVGIDGHTVHLPDAKGLRDLHLLLSQPGTDLPAVQLLSPEGGEVVVAARRLGGDPILDEEAKARYKRRLTQLDDEIDRAVERADDVRAAALDQERHALLEELRTAAGLAGRSRRLGDEAERARKTVTARIRDALRKLDERHPELAAHLRATVSTGATCRYHPDRPTPWQL
jgi:tetratricopeptide (TPR) repeat protein